MGILDLLYGKNRPAPISATEVQGQLRAAAEEANRVAEELERSQAKDRPSRPKLGTVWRSRR